MAYLKNRTFSIYVKGFYKTFEIKIVNNVEQYVISTKQKKTFFFTKTSGDVDSSLWNKYNILFSGNLEQCMSSGYESFLTYEGRPA